MEDVWIPSASRTADTYESLGITQHGHGDFTSALESNKRALDIRLKVFGEKHPKTADSYYLLGVIQHSLGDFLAAFESDRRALDIRLKLFGEDHSKTADSYYSVGVTQYSLGYFIPAQESSERALKIRLKRFWQKNPATADCYYLLGAIQNALGDFLSALESNQRALDIKLKLLSQGNIDNTYRSFEIKHAVEDATLTVHRRRPMPRTDLKSKMSGNECSESANTYHSLGIAQYASGDYQSAFESNSRALEIRRGLFGDRHSKTADSYHALGITQHALGDFLSALELNKHALEIRVALFGVGHSKVADSYDSIGLTQQEQGHFHSALQSNRRALNIRIKLFGELNSKTADSYFSLGVTQYSLGYFRPAFDSHEKSLHIRLKLFGEEHPKAADSYYSLAITQHSLGDFLSAYDSSERAFRIGLKLFGESHSASANSHHLLDVTLHAFQELARYMRQKLLIIGVGRPDIADTELAKETPEYKPSRECTVATPQENEGNVEAVANVSYEGGEVVAKDVQVNCPYGAIGKQDENVTIKITLEKPSTHCDMIVKSGLENDIMFIAPIVNLQPSGHVFKKPVTVTTKLIIDRQASPNDVLILHGVQARNGKIVWQDITHKSKVDLEKKEVKVEIEGFSRIAALMRLTSILTKNVITRLNLVGFNYTLSVLFKGNHPHAPLSELALVFMSHDIYHEKCYRDHPSSVLMQLKESGFEELCSIDRTESNRIYNNETLKISVLLGHDYKLYQGQCESTDLVVESSTWWSTGKVIKLFLTSIDDVRVLCGRIGIAGQYGHVLEETFCELDRCEYVKRLLRVDGSILNLKPIAKHLDIPEQGLNEAIKTWNDDEEQLKIILQHWSKEQDESFKEDPAVLRESLQGINPEECEVNERGKMHINNLRELASEIQGLNREDPNLTEYFTNQITNLCDCILRDCCIEVDAEVSVENYPQFLSFHQLVTAEVARKLEKICLSSTRSINEDLFSILPFLIQAIKEIFQKESPLIVQNGLKGLPKETVSQYESKVRDAFLNQDILRLVYEVCGVLEQLCLNNCEKHSTEEIEIWSESLGIWKMSEFLKGFFQSSQDCK